MYSSHEDTHCQTLYLINDIGIYHIMLLAIPDMDCAFFYSLIFFQEFIVSF